MSISNGAWPLPLQQQCPKLTRVLSSIDALPATVELALDQIERATGMKAFLLIGGPAPAADGDFSTHV